MGFMDESKNRVEDMKDTIKSKTDDFDDAFHEKKGEIKGRMDQADADMAEDEDDDDDEDDEGMNEDDVR